MIKVNILKNNEITNSASFATQELADSWLAQEIANNSFGKSDRWLSFLGEPDQGYTNTRQVENITEYFYPSEYSIQITDISSQILAQQESEEALKFLRDTDYKVIRHNGQLALGISTTLTHSQYLALEQQRQEARSKVL